MRDIDELMEQLHAANGTEPADLALTNVKWVNVHSEEVLHGTLYVKSGRIVGFRSEHSLPALVTTDCQGRFAIPGLIDGHVHIEPTLLTPEALGEVIVPHGTTTLLVEGMEIANVAGSAGLRALTETSLGRLPYNIWLQVSSRVPTAPGLETTGGEIGLDEVRAILEEEYSVSCGELDPSKVLQLRKPYLEKVLAAKKMGKIANGHAIGLDWNEMNLYACAGLTDDHECVTFDEMLMRIRLGMTVMIREGSTERNLETLIRGLLEYGLNTEYIAFCTDDKHANEIQSEGHMNYMVNRAIELGVPPMKAIKMCTINTARHFRIDHEVGSLTPGRFADIVLVDDLSRIVPAEVYFHGELVAVAGKMRSSYSVGEYPAFLRETVHLADHFTEKSLQVAAEGHMQSVRVINLYSDQIINFGSVESLKVEEGIVQCDLQRDILKLAVVERYGKNGNVGVGFVRGFCLQEGALGCSVSHDHHNIVVVGTNDSDMALAARVIEEYQGALVAVSHGVVKAVLPLPIAGLMSDKSAQEVIDELNQLNAQAEQLGCSLPAPFMTLSFISLPTVPELGLTDYGLIDVKTHRVISTLVTEHEEEHM